MNDKNEQAKRTQDGWANVVTGLGTDIDKRTAFGFRGARRISPQQLSDQFEGDYLTARICELPAREMIRKWVRLDVTEDTEARDAMTTALADLGTAPAFQEAITWSRLFGGGGILMGLMDGGDLDEPVNVERLQSVEWLTPVDRCDLRVKSYFTDPLDARFDRPEFYDLQRTGAASVVVHESRLLIFDGAPLPARARRRRDGWGASVIERADEAMSDYLQGVGGAAHALTDFAQAVIKIQDLADMLAQDNEGLVLQRLRTLQLVKSTLRMIPLDAETEDYTRVATPLSGIPETLDRLAEAVASAVEIPMSILLGRAPAGLNATGEADLRWFYDTISAAQQRLVVPQLRQLVGLLFNASNGPTGGKEPDGWTLETVPLWQLDEKQQAEIRKMTAETDAIYFELGVLAPDEIRSSRFGTESFSTETTISEETAPALTGLPVDGEA